MSVRAARLGIPSKERTDMLQEQARKSEALRLEAARMLENPVWTGAVGELKDAYTNALLNCPEKDDRLRYQLQMALKVFKKVEDHIIMAHSRSDFDTNKAIRADFGSKSWKNPFRS